WHLTLDKPLVQLFKPDEGYIGVGLLGGDVRLLDATTGRTTFSSRVPGAHFVFDAVLAEGTLVVKYLGEQNTSAPPELAGLELESGAVLWKRSALAPAMGATPLRMIGGTLPTVVRNEFPRGGPREASQVCFINVRTGENVGTSVVVPFTDAMARFNGDLVVYPGRVLVGTTHGAHAFSTEPLGPGTGNGM
ncbi:MAG: hypothetical protein ACE5HE_14650, partial [Phycisphaerae bacterium]